jgi:hypothetical protein
MRSCVYPVGDDADVGDALIAFPLVGTLRYDTLSALRPLLRRSDSHGDVGWLKNETKIRSRFFLYGKGSGRLGRVAMVEQIRGAVVAKHTGSRWPALFALLALGGLYAALPRSLVLGGGRWLLLIVIVVFIVPAVITHRRGAHRTNQFLGYLLNSVVTIAMIGSLVLLIRALPAHVETPPQLLQSAAALWGSNILVFASWYWRLDAGGPHKRAQRSGHVNGAFLFPQMTLPQDKKGVEWTPNFVDYLFLAFNTSTAFSPTDVPVLSRWAKILMMTQSLISLLIIALLAARAVNIL